MSDVPLYLLPGLLCEPAVWKAQADELGRDRKVVVPDFWGFDSITGMARSVLETAPPRFAVAGHSMGGRVALEVIRLAPEQVDRLALLDTGTAPVRPGEPERRQNVIDLAYREGMAALAKQWLPPMVHPRRLEDREFMAALEAMVCRATPEIHEKQIRALLGRPDAQAALEQVKCPLLIACGRDDAWSPPAQHVAMAASVPGAKLAIIEDCGHMSTVEQPAEVTRLIREWLEA